MDLYKDKYVIVEVIPTRSNSKEGVIAQISALKLEGLKLLDRFDYRIMDKYIDSEDLLRMISYDKNMFTYIDNTVFIPEKFREFVEDLPLLLIEDKYTRDYLSYLDNKKELVYPYIDVEYNDKVFDTIKDKYKLEDSNHLVDLIYEAIIFNEKDSEKNE